MMLWALAPLTMKLAERDLWTSGCLHVVHVCWCVWKAFLSPCKGKLAVGRWVFTFEWWIATYKLTRAPGFKCYNGAAATLQTLSSGSCLMGINRHHSANSEPCTRLLSVGLKCCTDVYCEWWRGELKETVMPGWYEFLLWNRRLLCLVCDVKREEWYEAVVQWHW